MVNAVYFHVPNVIGYARVVIGALAFVYSDRVAVFALLYSVSFVLDAADGYAARALKQSSELGAFLDMITDRVGTLCLLTLTLQWLTAEYVFEIGRAFSALGEPDVDPWKRPALLLAASPASSAAVCALVVALAMLDGVSHWMQMLAGVSSRSGSHKSASESGLILWYYWRPVLTVVCIFNELFLLMLYILLLQTFPSPALAAKASTLSRWSTWHFPMPFVWAMLVISAPVCALKQAISVRQIVSAHAILKSSLNDEHSESASTKDTSDVRAK
mmetsp:Transcript_12546/g.33812  ORF Transcript_12546/g.33812 Transcript_12546/m.33812 type:complete len:273 (-) Transcript_12546:730-1548(-)